MQALSEDFRRLFEDCELFVSEILQEESLGKHARETREILLSNFQVLRTRHPNEFQYKDSASLYSKNEDSSDDTQSLNLAPSLPSDNASVASDYQDEGSPEYPEVIALVGVQELTNIQKQGYLEKKRRDHSFFGSEWQKRWCVLDNNIFYYFGSDKDKQQKGAFYINGYGADLLGNLRKDSKKNSCFELSAAGRRSFQFTASSPKEAKEWVRHINFVLKDQRSPFIPFDEEEEDDDGEGKEDQEEEETYDDIDTVSSTHPPSHTPRHSLPEGEVEVEEEEEEEDIYEVLPEDDFPPGSEGEGGENGPRFGGSVDYGNYYQSLWDCAGDQPDELSFQRGDLIYILSKEYNIHGWWVGELNGSIGIVPKDFLATAYIL
ncbi:src kinase-associated phosphoprotein 1 isoform X2 [Polyodon spathula]|uniref:src kinase-associated phosphoprotein 1 isoform X2 n=1 Tax=Polyodon spathula TaxID=7913 RepID=UPI001B7E3F4C|nr:src kinase-associated phosphoprotein 1 isoform X2 [Polyodon spathula]